jgi:hypothetical protein
MEEITSKLCELADMRVVLSVIYFKLQKGTT